MGHAGPTARHQRPVPSSPSARGFSSWMKNWWVWPHLPPRAQPATTQTWVFRNILVPIKQSLSNACFHGEEQRNLCADAELCLKF